MGFNQAQKDASEQIDGMSIIIACPGSGKTTTLIQRLVNIRKSGIAPERILMVTFSTGAAKEMKKRYRAICGKDEPIRFATIHSMCWNILKQETGTKPELLVNSPAELAIRIRIGNFLEYKKRIKDGKSIALKVIDEIGLVKNNMLDIRTYNSVSVQPDIFREVYELYQEALKEAEVMDFEDLMLATLELFQNDAHALARWQEAFLYIQCDEYQDTNPVQKELLYLLSAKHQNLCVVGDDDQSIYGFRGAKPRIMMDFKNDFPSCTVYHLDTNYRSGQTIINTAENLIRYNTDRFEKQFLSDRGKKGFNGTVTIKDCESREKEIEYLVSEIEKKIATGDNYSEIAVLIRNNNLANRVFSAFAERNIPFYAKETIKSLYETWEYRVLCSYLNLSMGTYTDNDIKQAIRTPNKYLRIDAFKNCAYSISEMKQRLSYITAKWQKKNAMEAIETMFKHFGPFRFTPNSNPKDVIAAYIGIGIVDEIVSMGEKMNLPKEDALMNLLRLKQDAEQFSTLREWQAYAERDIRETERLNKERQNPNGIYISTMHGAKGLEWKTVFVIDANQQITPGRSVNNEEQMEEERRVFYVAMTRAKDDLYLLSSASPSQFLKEARKAKDENTPKTDREVQHASESK